MPGRRMQINATIEPGTTQDLVWTVDGETVRIDVMAAETPSIQSGDRIVIGGETFEVQGEPIRDRERLIVTLDLRPI